MYMTTLISKTTSPFCHDWQKVSKSGSHLIVTERASILILIIIVGVTIIVLILRCLWRKRGRLYEATKVSPPLSNTTNIGVHLTQLIIECVKASIHALKLRHDRLEGHTTHRWRSGCRWSGRSWRSRRLSSWPLRPKLGLAPSNGSIIYGIHSRKVCRLKIGDRKNGGESA